SPDLVVALATVADWKRRAGDLDGAHAAVAHALEVAARTEGVDSQDGEQLETVDADVLHAQGKPTDAIAALRRAADIAPKVLGPAHVDTASRRYDLASELEVDGEPAEARAEAERARAIYAAAGANGEMGTAATLALLGQIDLG